MTTAETVSLRRLLDSCVANSDAEAAFEESALAEAEMVLDGSLNHALLSVEAVDAEGLFEVAKLHLVRSVGLHQHPDQEYETAAYVALYVLIAVADPGWLPPQVIETVDTAILAGVGADLPAAATAAAWCHAAAVRAQYRRTSEPSLDIADLVVSAFQRVADVADPGRPGRSDLLIALAGAYETRARHRPPGDPGVARDLSAALDRVDEGLANTSVPDDVRQRGHRLRTRLSSMRQSEEPDNGNRGAFTADQDPNNLPGFGDPARELDAEQGQRIAEAVNQQSRRHGRSDASRRILLHRMLLRSVLSLVIVLAAGAVTTVLLPTTGNGPAVSGLRAVAGWLFFLALGVILLTIFATAVAMLYSSEGRFRGQIPRRRSRRSSRQRRKPSP
jgi:hypothetical protein